MSDTPRTGVLAGSRRRMLPRDRDEEHRVSTPLELLFDLCFVVSVSQAAAELHHGLAAGRVGHSVVAYLMVFFAIWWAWMNFTWFASAYDTDDAPYRLLTLLQMTGALVLAAGVQRGFEHDDFGVVTLGYVIMRVAMVAQWLRAARGDVERRGIAIRFAAGISAVQLGWVSRLLLPDRVAFAAFFPLAVLELAVPVWAERSGHGTPWHPEHIAERYGLFTLIVLGESILAATTAIQAVFSTGGLSPGLLAVSLAGLLLVFSFWWSYFDRDEDDGLREHRRRGLAWGYGHYAIFAALAGLGAGLQVGAEAAEHHADVGPVLAALSIAVPVAVCAISKGALRVGIGPRRGVLTGTLTAAVVVLLAAVAASWLTLPVSVLLIGLTMVAALAVQLRGRES